MCSNSLYDVQIVGVASSWKKLLLLAVIFSLFIVTNVSAQILVAGTSFDPKNPTDAAGRAYIGMTDITHVGFQTGAITVVPPITPTANANVFHSTFQHAVTKNPYTLDNTRYTNLPAASQDYMLVVSPTAGNTTILNYRVANLTPGSAVRVEVTYCSVMSPSYASCTTGEIVSLKGVVNPDQYNTTNGTEGTQVSAGGTTAGGCTTMNITQASGNSNPVGADGTLNFYLNTQQTGNCKAIGIKSIMVYGTPKPKAMVAEGSEVCTGEQVTLQSTQDYNGTYQWQVSTNGGSSYSNVPGGTNKTSLHEIITNGTYMYRAIITPTQGGSNITTDPATVIAAACCTENGAAASRKTIYYDNFGRVNLSNTAGTSYYVWDYSNPLAPVEVAKTTTTPFRWTLTPAPLNAAFKATGPPEDGQYAVAAYLTGYSSYNGITGARMEWANRVTGPTAVPNPDITMDHSGTYDGAALFLNCPPNTGGMTLYERTIPALCTGKQLFFECWIAVFTNEPAAGFSVYNPVDVSVRLTDGGNAANVTTGSTTATRQVDGGGVWKKVSGQITLQGSSLKMEIINNQNTSISGNDLVLDDIKIMACAPPPIDAYFDIPTLLQSKAICSDPTLPLYTKPSAMLKNYFGNNPAYLFQWSRTPNVLTSWTNLGSPVSGTAGESYTINSPRTHASFNGLPDGGKVYFRVIASTPGGFAAHNNFVGAANTANINDPCKDYSISETIVANISCPLPVELVSFKAFKNGDKTQLAWSTSSEKDNHYFMVERSSDGIEFTAIGKVEGVGTSDLIQTYQFVDENPLNGISYYRLKQVDFDGRYDYSKTVSMNDTQSDVTVYPNPNNGSFSVQIFAPGQSYLLEIADAQGQIIYSNTGAEAEGTLEVSNIPSGFYLVRLSTDTQVLSRKLVVH